MFEAKELRVLKKALEAKADKRVADYRLIELISSLLKIAKPASKKK